MRRCTGATVALLAALTLLATAATAVARKPVLLSVRVSPKVLPSTGGEITISVRVDFAAACTLYSEGLGAARTLPCSSGRLTYRKRVPANTGIQPEVWAVHVEARSGASRARSGEVEVEVPPNEGTVLGLDACTAGPECDVGPIHETFAAYGNTATLGDCTFAAAANWEQILLHNHPEPQQIASEFGEAAGTQVGGLSQTAFINYWMTDGIGGVEVAGLQPIATDPADVRAAIGAYTALIVGFNFAEGDYIGEQRVTAGAHEAVVDGYTPEGPLVVTWGQTVQMTWEQWENEVVAMWAVAL